MVTAAVTDVWESPPGQFARLLGRGCPQDTDRAQWLAQTREQLTVTGPSPGLRAAAGGCGRAVGTQEEGTAPVTTQVVKYAG